MNVFRFNKHCSGMTLPEVICRFTKDLQLDPLSIRLFSEYDKTIQVFRGNGHWEVMSADDAMYEIIHNTIRHLNKLYKRYGMGIEWLTPYQYNLTKKLIFELLVHQAHHNMENTNMSLIDF